MEGLSEKLKELRKKKGWTQEDTSREIHVSLSTVQRWEKKGGEPTRLARRERPDSPRRPPGEWQAQPRIKVSNAS